VHLLPTVAAELNRWSDEGRVASLWLRDDDAHEPGRALDELLARIEAAVAPCLLAIVPMKAGRELADALSAKPLVRVAMHGVWHANHAPAGRKSEETPRERGLGVIAEELGAARKRLATLFGPSACDWYVPPWNRIGGSVAALLPGLGFRVLSTFGRNRPAVGTALVEVNTHVDIMNWGDGRVGHAPAEVLARLASELALARNEGWRPVGVLTHHLAHDERAWASLDAILDAVAAHPAALWRDPDALAEIPRSSPLPRP
jgi:peptidoglycan/xylan/chitin deacetylase (PgdA/CDA1 family)